MTLLVLLVARFDEGGDRRNEELDSGTFESPPRMLERLSCSEKMITPVTTAEVATIPERVTPLRDSNHNPPPA